MSVQELLKPRENLIAMTAFRDMLVFAGSMGTVVIGRYDAQMRTLIFEKATP